MAGLDLRPLPLLRARTREPLRRGTIHRLPAQRRLRRIRACRRTLLLRPARARRCRCAGTAAVCGPDRLSRARHGRKRPAAWHLRLRRSGPYHHPGRAVAGSRGVRLHPQRRPREPGLRAPARCGLGRRRRPGTTAGHRRGADLRPVGALVPAALRVMCKGGTVVCAGIHMSDIPAFPTTSCGANGASFRSPT